MIIFVDKEYRFMEKLKSSGIKRVRTIWDEQERKWYFVVADVIQKLTHNRHPRDYTKKLRKYDKELAKVWDKLVVPVEVHTNGGLQFINCTDLYGILRILRSVRSPRARTFLNWTENLTFDPNQEQGKIEVSKQSLEKFYKILAQPETWRSKKKKLIRNCKNQPSYQKMNELEMIFALLDENDFIDKKS